MIRVILPTHLHRLANIPREIEIEVIGPATLVAVLDAVEARYPVLVGTMRDPPTRQRRPFIRFFACGEDWSHESQDRVLPVAVIAGNEPLRVVGAMAGG